MGCEVLRGGLRSLEPKESEIDKAIGDFLFYMSGHGHGFAFWKQNVRGYLKGKVYETESGKKIVVGEFRKDANPYARTGLPDWAIVYRGFYCGWETKTHIGRQSPNQIEFEKYITKKGEAPYYLIRDLDDAKDALNEFTAKVDQILKKK